MHNNPKLQIPFISEFLNEFKILVSEGKLNIIPRRKNYATMLELTPDLIKEILLSLTIDDYVCGPEKDRDRPDEYVWKFGKDFFKDKQIYIKLKIVDKDNDKEARIISFHYAEREMKNKRF
ncbi:hypothetical protein [Lactobacillus helsingborgensis]|uniref:hypothetical protein n=1 Tax=Lactobacillus helsingborgensis TaxID=1218494 RepID=UPI002264FB9D|nr:hypothetical protein [Lactobacillus helsingborgensis]UZX31585.1 type II toxin-antitoxin system MqsR family toxin [Lactobacillus helsingborgensis]